MQWTRAQCIADPRRLRDDEMRENLETEREKTHNPWWQHGVPRWLAGDIAMIERCALCPSFAQPSSVFVTGTGSHTKEHTHTHATTSPRVCRECKSPVCSQSRAFCNGFCNKIRAQKGRCAQETPKNSAQLRGVGVEHVEGKASLASGVHHGGARHCGNGHG